MPAVRGARPLLIELLRENTIFKLSVPADEQQAMLMMGKEQTLNTCLNLDGQKNRPILPQRLFDRPFDLSFQKAFIQKLANIVFGKDAESGRWIGVTFLFHGDQPCEFFLQERSKEQRLFENDCWMFSQYESSRQMLEEVGLKHTLFPQSISHWQHNERILRFMGSEQTALLDSLERMRLYNWENPHANANIEVYHFLVDGIPLTRHPLRFMSALVRILFRVEIQRMEDGPTRVYFETDNACKCCLELREANHLFYHQLAP